MPPTSSSCPMKASTRAAGSTDCFASRLSRGTWATMSRRRHLSFGLALALVLGACDETQSASSQEAGGSASVDNGQILEAVLAHEASLPRESQPVCVASRTEGVAFDSDRDRIRMLREARPQNPPEADLLRRALAGSETWIQEWRLPV